MRIINSDKTKINDVVDVLASGGLVIMPTETLYGAFVDATNKKAVDKLTKYKARPFGKPYSVAVADINMAKYYVDLNQQAIKLYRRFLPGPLTVVSKGKHKVAPGVESENGTLGIRIPDYKFVLDVVKKLRKPITATSANASYKKRPYNLKDVLNNLSSKQKSLIDLMIDAGELPHNEPSTVVDTTLDDTVILRQGNINFDKKNIIVSFSEESTMNLAKDLIQKYEMYIGSRTIVFALEGQMGSGKTIFTKGLGKALGINNEILSPTYDLELSYTSQATGNRLVHIDLWRMLDAIEELKSLDIKENIKIGSVIAIEWADKIVNEIKKYFDDAIIIWLKIEYGRKENERLMQWKVI